MRKLLLLAASLAVGCSDPVSPNDFHIMVSTAPATIKAGESMQLQFVIHNESNQGHFLAMNACYPPFEIVDAAGDVVGPGPRACALSLTAPVLVEANSSVETTDTWTGESTATTSSGAPIYLPSGTYRVRPFVDVVGIGKSYGSSVTVTIVP